MCTHSVFTCRARKQEVTDKFRECEGKRKNSSDGTPIPEKHTVAKINFGHPPGYCDHCGCGPHVEESPSAEFQVRIDAARANQNLSVSTKLNEHDAQSLLMTRTRIHKAIYPFPTLYTSPEMLTINN